LGIDHVVVERVEAQQPRGHFPVERERRAVAGGRSQRILVADAVGGQQHFRVVDQALRIGSEPKTERRRHGDLPVRIARHQHLLVLFGQLLQHSEQFAALPDDFA